MTAPLTTDLDPSTPDLAHRAQCADWVFLEDAWQGTTAIRGKGETYLPRHPAERPASYARRLSTASWFNAFAETVSGLTGMIFRTPPSLADDVPPLIAQDWEDIDGQGTHGEVFARLVEEDALTKGHAAILVDYPPVADPAAVSLADEQALNLRPYWRHVRAEDVLSVRTVKVGARILLDQAALREDTTESAGRFTEVEVCRVRVYSRLPTKGGAVIMWELWRQIGDAKAWIVEQEGTLRGVTEIPLVPVYGGRREGWFRTKPPLRDLAETNLEHYQVKSDHRFNLHMSSVPIPCFKGRQTQGAGQTIAPDIGIDLSETGDAFYLETEGRALSETRSELKDLEGRMASQGLAMLAQEQRQAETALAKQIDKAEQGSKLAVAARGLQDALEQALKYHAQFRGLATGGSILVNREFEQLSLDPAMLAEYRNMVVEGSLSLDTLWRIMRERGALPNDFDPEGEKAAIADAMLANAGTMPDAPADPNAGDAGASGMAA